MIDTERSNVIGAQSYNGINVREDFLILCVVYFFF